ncbi:hypothetical protein [Streptomyces anulatus]|uniref:hypothetical protein n=1 Tax=Streptomyces anulatus TaxID=1892 RepID=UPI0033E3FC63
MPHTAEQEHDLAHQAVLALNKAMTCAYADALTGFQERMLATTPVVLALFDGAGGRMILHRPGLPAEHAPTVPPAYQCLKALAHSTVAVYEILTHHSEAGPGLREAAHHHLHLNRNALKHLPNSGLKDADIEAAGALLTLNQTLLEEVLSSTGAAPDGLHDYAQQCVPSVIALTDRAAALQVGHWMAVLDGWRAALGTSWNDTLAAVNTLYVTRQKNILFTVLAQYLGEEAIGERLMLFETPEFTTTPDQMLDLLARVVSDRGIGCTFFGHSRVMDVEILGDAARQAIVEETKRRGMAPALPPAAPFDNREWPWSTDPHNGTGPSTLRTAVGHD